MITERARECCDTWNTQPHDKNCMLAFVEIKERNTNKTYTVKTLSEKFKSRKVHNAKKDRRS